MRNNLTDTEWCLWRYLRCKQLDGLKFRRQQPIGPYVVDFVSFEKRIVIELDGGQHSEEIEEDKTRDQYLTKNNFRVLRFWNNEVNANIEGVLETIGKACAPFPTPSRRGRGMREKQ